MAKPGRKKKDKTAAQLQQFLSSSKDPEEILFKLNEFLYGSQTDLLRKNPRIPVNLPLTFKCGTDTMPGNTYTLSREGVFIKTATPAKAQSDIEIKFFLPENNNEIVAKGKVVHCVEFDEAKSKGLVSGMAVVFSRIAPSYQKLLDDFINSRVQKMYAV
jgi:hypothetical protein